MIKKDRRLMEREIRKVLSRRKPFFSYDFIANVAENRIGKSRFAVVFSWKVTKTSVDRNFYRRRFYDLVSPYLESARAYDVVVVAKKWQVLSRRDLERVERFDTDMNTLLKKVFS